MAVRQADGRLLLVADAGGRVELSTGVGALRPTANPRWLAATTADSAFLFDLAARKVRDRVSALGLLDAVALLDEGGVPFAFATLAADEVRVHYLDAPGVPAMPTVLPQPATRLAAAPGGRVLLAWSPKGGPLHVIDVARGRLVRSASAQDAITEVAFSDRSAYLMLESQTHVGALDLLAVARGDTAEFREIPIGSPVASGAPEDQSMRQLLAPLCPLDGILAVHAESFQGYRIMDSSMTGDAPAMTATALRGGVPMMVAALDRSFRDTGGAVFETVARLPGPGRFELVATTGLGALSFCAELPVAVPQEAPEMPVGSVRLLSEGRAVRLLLLDAEDAPAANRSGRLRIEALQGGWRNQMPITTDANGRTTIAFVLPDSMDLLLKVELSGEERFEAMLREAAP